MPCLRFQSSRYFPVILWAFAAACFFWIHRVDLSVGLMDEDFAWLNRISRESPWAFLGARPDVYYRPLSANLPYLYFLRAGALLPAWHLLSLLLVFASAFFLFRLVRLLDPRIDRSFAFVIAMVWLLSPAHYFGLSYLNAFDYVLFPFTLFGFLFFLLRSRLLPAVFFLLLGLGCKELGALFFVFASVYWLLTGRGAAIAASSALITLLFLGWKWAHSGLGGGHEFIKFPYQLATNLRLFTIQLFWPLVGRGAESWSLFACFLFAAALLFLLFKRPACEGSDRSAGFLLLFAFLALAAPLLLVFGVQYDRLGGIFWGLLLPLLAPFLFRLFPASFWQGSLLGLALAARAAAEDASLLARDRSLLQNRFIERAASAASGCRPGTTVVLMNMNAVFRFTPTSEHVFWGLLARKQPHDYRLLQAPGEAEPIPPHQPFYLTPEGAGQHPQLHITAGPGADGYSVELKNGKGQCLDRSA